MVLLQLPDDRFGLAIVLVDLPTLVGQVPLSADIGILQFTSLFGRTPSQPSRASEISKFRLEIIKFVRTILIRM